VECRDCLRRVAIHFRIDQKRHRQFQIGKELRQAKDTDTIAVVAPGENAVTVGLIGWGNGRPFPGAIANTIY